MKKGDAGFSLVELLIATAISLTATVLACRLAMGAQVTWRVASARVDLQQRARAGADTLSRALLEAGGGAHTGAARGPLLRHVPPIVPRRIGVRGAHPPTEFRRDAFTVIGAIAETTHARLFTPAASTTTTIDLAPVAGCEAPTCGFAEGATVMLLDTDGTHDIYTVTALAGALLTVRPHGAGSGRTYAVGTPLLSISSTSFLFDASGATLRQYDGDGSDVPVMDDVVGMEVRYYGSVRPPLWPRPRPADANCLYDAGGVYHAALMPLLAGVGGLIELTAIDLTDGPWCGSGPTQFDADLLRIRRVRIALRLQASDPAVRGSDRRRFLVPGTAFSELSMVPDITVTVDSSSRNLTQ